jgi:diacylglycerol kinase (ATP)
VVLLITNERAGRAQMESIASAVDELVLGGDVEVLTCHRAADLDDILDRRDGRPLVLAGGDGTLHSALGALWRRGETATCPVGLIPLGTGNDFARGVGLPLDPVRAAVLVRDGQPRPIDLVSDDAGGVVVNAMHVGVGADAAAAARPLKPTLRIGAFLVGALVAGARAEGWRLRVEVDGEPVASGRRRIFMAGLANAPTIAGGTAVFAPQAQVDDGVFDVTVSLAVRPMARVGYAMGLLRGTHPDRADVIYQQARTLSVSGEPFHVDADGELDGPLRHRTWTVQPGAWRCILPERPPADATSVL